MATEGINLSFKANKRWWFTAAVVMLNLPNVRFLFGSSTPWLPMWLVSAGIKVEIVNG